MNTKTDFRTISHSLGDALSQFSKLFQNEIDLAKAELGEKVQQIGGAVSLFAAGAILVIPAIAVSYLISAMLAAVLAAILFAVGMNRLDARNLAPRETLRQLEKDKDAVKGMVQ
jgi:hypothetical protein